MCPVDTDAPALLLIEYKHDFFILIGDLDLEQRLVLAQDILPYQGEH